VRAVDGVTWLGHQRHVVIVPGKPYAREIDVLRLCAYLQARGWTDHPELIVPHEPGPHLFVHPGRGGQVYFANGWDAPALTDVVCKIADIEGRHPADVLDSIAASRF
jgi:hypothetical protein